MSSSQQRIPKCSASERHHEARAKILDAATDRFGRDGYEDTKWADIAADVGVGPTALYHYFESKQHCLFVIMDQAIDGFHSRFRELAESYPGHLDALVSILRDCFALSERDIQRNRVLVAEQGLLASRRESPREERARQAVREQRATSSSNGRRSWPGRWSRARSRRATRDC